MPPVMPGPAAFWLLSLPKLYLRREREDKQNSKRSPTTCEDNVNHSWKGPEEPSGENQHRAKPTHTTIVSGPPQRGHPRPSSSPRSPARRSLMKKDASHRPMAVGETLSSSSDSETLAGYLFRGHLHSSQLAFGTANVHTIRRWHQWHSNDGGRCLLTVDLENVFNQSDGSCSLREVSFVLFWPRIPSKRELHRATPAEVQ